MRATIDSLWQCRQFRQLICLLCTFHWRRKHGPAKTPKKSSMFIKRKVIKRSYKWSGKKFLGYVMAQRALVKCRFEFFVSAHAVSRNLKGKRVDLHRTIRLSAGIPCRICHARSAYLLLRPSLRVSLALRLCCTSSNMCQVSWATINLRQHQWRLLQLE